MPLHPDFQKLRRSMRNQYGKEKGDEVFWGYVNEHKMDETKPMDEQSKKAFAGLSDDINAGIDDPEPATLGQPGDRPGVNQPQPTPTGDPTKPQGLADNDRPITIAPGAHASATGPYEPHTDSPHVDATAAAIGKFLSIPAYHIPYVATPKVGSGSDGAINIKALILEEGHNVNNWRIPSKEFSRIAEQYKAGRQLRVDHDKKVSTVIGKSYDATVLKGSEVENWLGGAKIDGINMDGLYVGAAFEADPQDPQVRTNILKHYVVTGSIGVDAEAKCETCSTALKAGADGDMEKVCHHLDSGVYLENVEGKEYSYVAEPAFEHTQAFPSFAAAVDSRLHSSLLTSPTPTTQMSATPENKKVEMQAKADAHSKAEGDSEADAAARALAIYKQGMADAIKQMGEAGKFRADAEPKKEEDEEKEEENASATAESESEADATAESEGEADATVNTNVPEHDISLPGQKPKVGATFSKKTKPLAQSAKTSQKAEKFSLMDKVNNPTKFLLQSHPEYRELFRAFAEAPTKGDVNEGAIATARQTAKRVLEL